MKRALLVCIDRYSENRHIPSTIDSRGRIIKRNNARILKQEKEKKYWFDSCKIRSLLPGNNFSELYLFNPYEPNVLVK